MKQIQPDNQKKVQVDKKNSSKLKGFKTLRSKILLFVSIPLILSFLLLGIFIAKTVKQTVTTSTNSLLEAKSQLVAEDVSTFLKKYEETVNVLSKNKFILQMVEESDSTSPLDKHEYYKNVIDTLIGIQKEDSNISGIFLADVDAGQSINSNGSNKNYIVEERPWYSAIKEKGGLVITEPYEDINSKVQVTTIAVPIYAEGSDEIIAAIGLDLTLDQLNSIMSTYSLEKTGYFVLTTGSGQILFHPDSTMVNTSVEESDVSDNLRAAILTQQAASVNYTEDGIYTHGYVAPVGETGWVITAGLPDKEFMDSYSKITRTNIFLFVITLIVVIAMVLLVARLIVAPLKKLTKTANQIADGQLDISADVNSRDEVGQMADAINRTVVQLNHYIGYIQEITQVLGTMADGDMRIRLKYDYAGEFAPIKNALLNISTSLNQMFSMLHNASDQVNAGAGQVSSASQNLASGAAEQAATIEELSASITSIAQESENNLLHVHEAIDYVQEATKNAADGNLHMDNLKEAMSEIRSTSDQIANITKAIQDIAFQTNILALNAAIEAARAGDAGKGFAVVADEVRNLAAKSAEAAKQTVELIDKSSDAVARGDQVARETAGVLQIVAENSKLVNMSIRNVESATSAQTNAIGQITEGISQVSSVVQNNAATAEESSAASEELAAQAETLRNEISRFKLDKAITTTSE